MTGNPSRENPLNSVQDFRDFYARFVVRSAGSDSERLIAAFATVEREHYLGAGPWPVFAGSSYIDTISADDFRRPAAPVSGWCAGNDWWLSTASPAR
jgi:hypothetical protein